MKPQRNIDTNLFNRDRRSFCQATLGLAAAAIWAPAGFAAQADAVAQTTAGKVRGLTDGKINVFKGVPYGADTATTRFMPPAAAKSWSGERDATKFGAQAPQLRGGARAGTALLQSWQIPQDSSEDCLFVNVWTPGLRDKKKRPVMVYIHGGGFAYGSGAAHGYDGTRLAQRGDVVVVTVNHRLNIFGYLYLAELDARYADSGNAGQHDLIAALKWVRDNIEEFGGDPNNVLIFGESGGGAKICALMAMPAARGLFHRAVVESGPMAWGVRKEVGTNTAREVLKILNIAPGKLDALKTLSTAQLTAVYAKAAEIPSLRSLAPVVDGRGLPRNPFDPDGPAISARVPLLIGFNRTETTFVLSGDDNFHLTWEQLPDRIKPNLGKLDAHNVVAQYRKLMPKATASDIFFEVTTQTMMIRNALKVADAKASQKAAPVWMYELMWETPVDGGKWRSPHTLEIGLVFDNVAKSESLYGPMNANAQKLADQMSEAWIAFARSGNPQTSALPQWAAYDATQRAVMLFDLKSRVANNPMGPSVQILQDAPYWDMTA